MTITHETTRAELEEAMAHVVSTVRRPPALYPDRRAELHGELDALLGEWLSVGA